MEQGEGPMAGVGRPRVSIGIPVYNGERFLRDAVESAQKQSYQDIEILISDNASEDSTLEIAESYARSDQRVRVFRNARNLGASANYDVVLDHARGDYFCWLPSDDAMLPDYVNKCVEVLESDPDIILVFSRFLRREGTGQPETHPESSESGLSQPDVVDRVHKLFKRRILGPNWPVFGIGRVEVMRASGRIRPLIGADDYLTLELALAGRLHQIPEELFVLRTHPDAWHRSRQPSMKGLGRLLGTESVWAAQWFDTSIKARIVFPHWRRMREYARLIMSSDATAGQKVRMLGNLPSYAVSHWRRLAKELVGGAIQGVRSVIRTLRGRKQIGPA